jgi:hypothetical protein
LYFNYSASVSFTRYYIRKERKKERIDRLEAIVVLKYFSQVWNTVEHTRMILEMCQFERG